MCPIHTILDRPVVLSARAADREDAKPLWVQLVGSGAQRRPVVAKSDEDATRFCCRRRAVNVLRWLGPLYPSFAFTIHALPTDQEASHV